MTRVRPLGIALLFLFLTSCEQVSVGQREQIANIETIIAGTPSATATALPSPTGLPTNTPEPTEGPAPTPTATFSPTPTPLPPTPTPNPALRGFSFCNQTTGDVTSGRFSAQLKQTTTEGFPAFERLVLDFELSPDSTSLSATASCISEDDYMLANNEPNAPGAYVLVVDLPNWLHDDAFAASPLTKTLTFSNTRVVRNATFRFNQQDSAGATLAIALDQALPYRLAISENPLRLIVEVARASPLVSTSDMLTLPSGSGLAQPPRPLFFLLDGDIWRTESGTSDSPGAPRATPQGLTPVNATAINLTRSAEVETDLAVSPDGSRLAFCRAAPGLDPFETAFAAPSTLWIMNTDGTNARQLATVGVNCADPAFNLDGTLIAFSVDETGLAPTQRNIWVIPTEGGIARLLGNQQERDEWSRFAPQWLADGSLVYTASAQDGRNTLFLFRPDGSEREIGADLLLDNTGDVRYRSLGRPMTSIDGKNTAIEAIRADIPGADLLILDAAGTLQATIGESAKIPMATATETPTMTPTATPTSQPSPDVTVSDPVTPETTATVTEPTATPRASARTIVSNEPLHPYWTRPLAWSDDGTLLYLTTRCASTVVQDYTFYRYRGKGERDELLAAGQSLNTLGSATTAGDGLAYVVASQPASGLRGLSAITPRSATELWIWDLENGVRGQLLEANRGIIDLK
ncbi:MAG: hypothetical protein MI924_21360 [Chloroflexales bacterium]|nr:hypothetical protein [Chloroflexales bacterium]